MRSWCFCSLLTENERHADVHAELPRTPSDDDFYVSWTLEDHRGLAHVGTITQALSFSCTVRITALYVSLSRRKTSLLSSSAGIWEFGLRMPNIWVWISSKTLHTQWIFYIEYITILLKSSHRYGFFMRSGWHLHNEGQQISCFIFIDLGL